MFDECDFRGVNLTESEHAASAFRNGTFDRAILHHSIFRQCILLGSVFTDCRMRPLSQLECDCTLAVLGSCDLWGADVDLVRGRLTIRQALHRVDGRLELNDVKTNASVAVLPIPAPLVAILREHRHRQLEERSAAGSQWHDTGLFSTANGGYLEPRNVNRAFHTWCERADLPQPRVHDLLRSCATLLFTMGVQPATVQRILRHSSITVTTGTYVEVIERCSATRSMDSLFPARPAANESREPLRQNCRQTPQKRRLDRFPLVELRKLEPLTPALPV